jgi:site-specific recombinase XerD
MVGRDELKVRYATLNGNVVRIGRDDRTVFCAPEGGPLDYKNFRDRVWAPLLERTAPDEQHPKRVTVTGTLHMLRHSYATALIQSGENAKTVQTLMGHHSVASRWTSMRTRGPSRSRTPERLPRGCCCRVVAKR